MLAAPMTRRRRLGVAVAIALGVVLDGCGSASVSARREMDIAPPAAPAAIFVRDFELEAATLTAERGLLSPLPLPPSPPGPLGRVFPGPPGESRDAALRARELVDLMATTLVGDLAKAGFVARRLRADEPAPAGGWLVRGVFTEVNEGNQLRRAAIGFGAGETQLQVVVAVDDLAAGAPRPLYELETTAASAKLPGAVILLNPYVAAARFVLAGRDLEQNVKRTAGKIAADVAARVSGPTPTAR
jgi:hypothetical protein